MGWAFSQGSWAPNLTCLKGHSNDDLILDCALFFQQKYQKGGMDRGRGFYIWSGDKELCIKAMIEGRS